MDENKAYEIALLHQKMSAIFSKIVISTLLTLFMERPLENIDIKSFFIMFFAMYIIVSWGYFFIKITHNYLIGIVLAVVLFLALGDYAQKQDELLSNIIQFFMVLGFIIFDVINIIRYVAIKAKK